eukprot:SM000001S04721  [mRNA]  locus=s1:1818626:1820459:- [translate_table: standard]
MAPMAGRHAPLSVCTSCRCSPVVSKRHRVQQPQEGASAQPARRCERRGERAPAAPLAKPGAALPPRSPAAQVEAVLRSLLAGNAKIGDVSGTISSRVHDKVLLLDSVVAEGGGATRARRREIHEQGRRSRHRMSMRQHRRQGSFDIKPPLNRHEYSAPVSQANQSSARQSYAAVQPLDAAPKNTCFVVSRNHRYELYMPLHNLWAAYMRRLMENCSVESVLYHSEVSFSSKEYMELTSMGPTSPDPLLVGLSGIVVKDMQRSFHIVARDNTVRIIPKDGAVFCLSVDSLKVLLYGGQLSFLGRPAERAATVEL